MVLRKTGHWDGEEVHHGFHGWHGWFSEGDSSIRAIRVIRAIRAIRGSPSVKSAEFRRALKWSVSFWKMVSYDLHSHAARTPTALERLHRLLNEGGSVAGLNDETPLALEKHSGNWTV